METKVCSRADCPHKGEPQPLANFYRNKRAKDGYRYECKTCMDAMNARWAATHRDRHLALQSEASKRLYWRDPERERERINRSRKQLTEEGVQRNTLYVRAYRARQCAEREGK